MAITPESAAQRARDLITQESESVAGFSVPEIIAMEDIALKMLAKNIAMSSDGQRQNLLRAVSATGANVIAGIADLASNFSTDRVLREAIAGASIRLNPDTNGFPFQWSETRAQLALPLPTDALFLRYTVENDNLFTRDTTGNLLASLGALEVVANFIALLDNSTPRLQLPFSLEDELVQLLAQVAIQNIAPRQRALRTGNGGDSAGGRSNTSSGRRRP